MDILGINFSIDAAAALLRDGKIIAAVCEERFNRIKHTREFPSNSIKYCLQEANTSLQEIEHITMFWNPGVHLRAFNPRQSTQFRHHLEHLYIIPNYLLRFSGEQEREIPFVQVKLFIEGRKNPLTITYITHHLAHAASAFFVSPFEESAILTMDGYGEWESTLFAYGKGNHIEKLGSVLFPHSIGSIYAAVTEYLGFRPNYDEGKVMGLSAFGTSKYVDKFLELVNFLPDGGFEVDLAYFSYFQERPTRYTQKFVEAFGPPRKHPQPVEDRHKDIAFALQRLTEKMIFHCANYLYKRTGSKNLCIAGGVGLNCLANGKIPENTPFENLFIQPASGDNGSSLGSALYLYHQILNHPRCFVMEHDYFGPGFAEKEIEKSLAVSGLNYRRSEDIAAEVARLLAAGAIVGWFQGRMEFGPRALGSRSILADPRPQNIQEKLNKEVKFREGFRPYAPSCIEEKAGEYFENCISSKFMLRAFKLKPEYRHKLPGIHHIDGTSRVHTVSENNNPLFYRLLLEFEKLSGFPMVLNTSFNVAGEPIVATPEQAIKTFISTNLSHLAIGDFLVSKWG